MIYLVLYTTTKFDKLVIKITEHVCLLSYVEKRRAIYNQFGEEGLKGGVPDGSGGFTAGYTFHGDPFKVFSTFFGGNNPFSGKYVIDGF